MDDCLRVSATAIIDSSVAQRIVGRDRLFFGPEQVEHARDHDSSPISAGRAMNDEGLSAAFTNRTHDRSDRRDPLVNHFQVPRGGGHRGLIGCADPVRECDLEKREMQMLAERQNQRGTMLSHFGGRPQIDDSTQTERTGESDRTR
jgi:hypothetical protein